MPLRLFKCSVCGAERETLRPKTPTCNHGQEEEGSPLPISEMREILTAPKAKMMETTDSFTGKSRPKNLTKVLRERSRAHARDKEADDLIQFNRKNGIEKSGFLRKDGRRRTKLDDI